MAERAELPVEHGDDARLGRMHDGIAQPVVAVVDARLVARRNVGGQPLLQRLHRFDVFGAGEIVLARPAGELTLDVLALPSVVAQTDGAVVDIVDARQHVVHRIEDAAAIGRRDAGHLRVGQDTAGQELHDIENRADH